MLSGYTDGATDGLNEAGEQFGETRLLAEAAEVAKNGGGELHTMFAAVESFMGDAEQYDDITMISVYRRVQPAS